ncbi:hypothetical protein IFM89_030712 [Coptis chinensis]|uniref:Xylanase inhibitor N-terminal domain-containing protein n=1 Tax=Coptis chinensis TaxID=261450 RepID=A0A835IYG9_9MAGN|nr:hypothetical protein IFM89_030712 [Coptis chinensis]
MEKSGVGSEFGVIRDRGELVSFKEIGGLDFGDGVRKPQLALVFADLSVEPGQLLMVWVGNLEYAFLPLYDSSVKCGYDQQVSDPTISNTDGVLGLGNGESSIVSQLRKFGITRNVIGHCMSACGGGFLFFGDDLVPSSGVVWTPMSRSRSSE